MNYQQSLDYLHDLCKFGINLGLERVTNLLNFLGNPHQKIKTIHIAGTNGKGSTTAILASILKTAGYRVGVYTSPHLHSYTERIGINGVNIAPKEFADQMEHIKDLIPRVCQKVGESPTEFEVLTALAFTYFAQQEVDIAVIEVGMGGRLDSTNVINPEIAVITSISNDHSNHLGPDLVDIAGEKAGVIKPKTPVVISKQQEPVAKVLLEKANKQDAPVYWLKDTSYEQVSFDKEGQRFNLQTASKKYEQLYLPLLGDHQIENAVAALMVIELLQKIGWPKLNREAVEQGLAKVVWPGRLEYLDYNPPILLDGAHNPLGAQALARSIEKYFDYKKLIMVLGILDDKDRREMLKYLAPLADILFITKPPNPRAVDWQSLTKLAKEYTQDVRIQEDFHQAITEAVKLADSTDLVCITGSLYLLGESRQYVLNTFSPS